MLKFVLYILFSIPWVFADYKIHECSPHQEAQKQILDDLSSGYDVFLISKSVKLLEFRGPTCVNIGEQIYRIPAESSINITLLPDSDQKIFHTFISSIDQYDNYLIANHRFAKPTGFFHYKGVGYDPKSDANKIRQNFWDNSNETTPVQLNLVTKPMLRVSIKPEDVELSSEFLYSFCQINVMLERREWSWMEKNIKRPNYTEAEEHIAKKEYAHFLAKTLHERLRSTHFIVSAEYGMKNESFTGIEESFQSYPFTTLSATYSPIYSLITERHLKKVTDNNETISFIHEAVKEGVESHIQKYLAYLNDKCGFEQKRNRQTSWKGLAFELKCDVEYEGPKFPDNYIISQLDKEALYKECRQKFLH